MPGESSCNSRNLCGETASPLAHSLAKLNDCHLLHPAITAVLAIALMCCLLAASESNWRRSLGCCLAGSSRSNHAVARRTHPLHLVSKWRVFQFPPLLSFTALNFYSTGCENPLWVANASNESCVLSRAGYVGARRLTSLLIPQAAHGFNGLHKAAVSLTIYSDFEIGSQAAPKPALRTH